MELEGLEQAMALVDLSNATVYNDTPASLEYAEKAYHIASSEGNDSLKYAALKAMGYANGYLGNFALSIQNMKDGLAYYQEIKDSSKIAEALSDIAYLMSATSSPEANVMEYNQRALAIREKINDEKGIAYSLNNIGALYWDWGKYDQSIEYFLRALPYLERLGLKEEIATTTGNVGSYYVETKEFDKARIFLTRALDNYRELNHSYGEAMIQGTMAKMNYLQGNIDEAIRLNQQSKAIREKLGDKEGLVANYYNIGYYHLQKNELSAAGVALANSRKIAEEIGLLNKLIEIYQALSDLGVKQKNYRNAYQYLEKSKALNDSVFSLEKHQQLEEIRTKFDVERREAENRELQLENDNQKIILRKNRFILYLSLSFAVLLLLFFVVYYQKRRTAYRMAALEAEQRLMRSQMNPHFIFNAITAIQNYVFTHSPKEAVNYLSAFAGLMRQILENSRRDFIELEDEIKWLKNYFSLQRLRYSDRFDYELAIDPSLSEQAVLIPPMVVQPFIENAIEHGIKELQGIGLIKLSYRRLDKNVLLVEVDDNGIGILKTKKKEGTKSFAVEATKKRLRVLHRKEKTTMRFELIDKSIDESEQSGTVVRFTLPYRMKF